MTIIDVELSIMGNKGAYEASGREWQVWRIDCIEGGIGFSLPVAIAFRVAAAFEAIAPRGIVVWKERG